MKRMFVLFAAICVIASVLFTSTVANAASKPLSVAVFGDWPYSASLLTNAPALTNSVNADPDARLVIHVGDIHSGSMPCTGTGLNPIPATSVPGWNQGIYNIFQQFNDPLVYTPGDNEWTDCHKTKQGSSGYPLNELAAVRSLFFAKPGLTLGGTAMEVESQAKEYEHDFSADAQFVENVMWTKSQVVFVTLNVPGSNNDTLPWKGGTGAFLNEAARQQEVTERNAANLRWLDRAFDEARESNAKGVVIALQANMWDPEALLPGGDGLNAYNAFVQELARLSLQFGRPVLLLNGDSHVYNSDQPLANLTSATGLIHGTPAVPNLTRITVQGSTNHPSEWLKLTIDPKSASVFSWENVAYLP